MTTTKPKEAIEMSAVTFPDTYSNSKSLFARHVSAYVKEAKYELIKNCRIPIYAISTIVFPLMFYILFGVVLGRNNPANRGATASYMLATMGCFGVIAAALFGFGVSLAMERGQGWLEVKRASPMPIGAYFCAKLFSAVAFSAVIMLVLLGVGYWFGGVTLPFTAAAKLAVILVAGALPFSAMGLAIGYFAKPNSAPAIVNLIYLPMSFCSGLWIPLFLLPHAFQVLAKGLPPYHLCQLALHSIGLGTGPSDTFGHIEALAGFTLICLGLALVGYHRDEGKTYG
jgi:ABC-2 type transport system permease protein